MRIRILLIIVLISSLFLSNKSFAENNPNIISEAAILIDSKTGQVLYEKNSKEKMYPASLTKIATAIYAIEKGNLNDLVTVSENAREVDGTRVYLDVGEEVKLKKLIQGLLINSGNDAGVAIAEHLGGDIETFAANLNKYISKLGAKNTNFENPHGLFHPDHVATAEDLAVITQYAMKNKDFREIFGTKELEWKGTSWETTIFTHHKLLREEPYEGVTGGKTGYVDQSGQTLITTAMKNDLGLIAVILNASTQQMIYNDTIELLDFGFHHYQTSFIPKGKFEYNDHQFLLRKDFYFTQPSAENVITKVNENGILEILGENQEIIAFTKLEEILEAGSLMEEKINTAENGPSRFQIGKYLYAFLAILFVLFMWAIVRNKRKRRFS